MLDQIKSSRANKFLKTALTTYGTAQQVWGNPIFKSLVLPKIVGTQTVYEVTNGPAFCELLDALLDQSLNKIIYESSQRHNVKNGWHAFITKASGVSRIGGKQIAAWALYECHDGYRTISISYPKILEDGFLAEFRLIYPLSVIGVYYHSPTQGSKLIEDSLAEKLQFVDVCIYDSIMERLDRFDAGREWYQGQGLPYKETILFYGPPGGGKTNMVRHIASKYKRSVHSRTSLPTNVDDLPKGAIVLIEDIDRIPLFTDSPSNQSTTLPSGEGGDTLQRFGRSESMHFSGHISATNQPTFSTILNVLDGPDPLDDIIIIMTANNPARLRKALHRPGRIDGKVHFDYISEERFYSLAGWTSEVLINHFDNVAGVKYRTASMVPIMRRCKTVQDIDTAMENIIFKESEDQEGY